MKILLLPDAASGNALQDVNELLMKISQLETENADLKQRLQATEKNIADEAAGIKGMPDAQLEGMIQRKINAGLTREQAIEIIKAKKVAADPELENAIQLKIRAGLTREQAIEAIESNRIESNRRSKQG